MKAENDHLGWFLDWSSYQRTRVVFRGLVHDFYEADWKLEGEAAVTVGPPPAGQSPRTSDNPQGRYSAVRH